MFTGIVKDRGEVRSITRNGDVTYTFKTGLETGDLELGASVACSGVCLTVIDKGPDWFAVAASAETLSKTTLGSWAEGSRVNFERSLRLGDEMGGHIVSGHVDGVAEVSGLEEEGDSLAFTFTAPEELMAYIATKGSVALDGVSLTVNWVEGERFGVNIIGHTRDNTTFGNLKTGDRLNLEIDMLARYVARLEEARLQEDRR